MPPIGLTMSSTHRDGLSLRFHWQGSKRRPRFSFLQPVWGALFPPGSQAACWARIADHPPNGRARHSPRA